MTEQGELFYMPQERQEQGQDGLGRGKWAGNLSKQARDVVRAMLPAYCWRGCGTYLEPDGKWTAGHITDRADGGGNEPSNLAPECEPCNYSHGGKRGAAVTNARKQEAVSLTRVRRVSWW